MSKIQLSILQICVLGWAGLGWGLKSVPLRCYCSWNMGDGWLVLGPFMCSQICHSILAAVGTVGHSFSAGRMFEMHMRYLSIRELVTTEVGAGL